MYAPRAAMAAYIVDWLSLPPKPPPSLLTLLEILAAGIFKTLDTPCWTSVGCCVLDQIVKSEFSCGMARAIWVSK